MIWHQINRYYFCAAAGEPAALRYSENEKKDGFRPVWISLEKAISCNRDMLRKEGVQPWNQRELQVLQLLKNDLENNGGKP